MYHYYRQIPVGVGGMVHFVGHGLKLMASPFLFQDNGMNKLIPKFFLIFMHF